ncbi:ABC transporter permease [Cryobacterium cheniae]|uniref:ABC transporter permease n=1 Tax=Cryobacterium cheniae TaxID=1259262 RepID=A0A4R8Y090_9MICO|nr:ABC transporter permease [Cryobacterium cheniae]TFC83773.1 ABC transporter permease [Cryobacterium cheniae]
MIALRQTLLLTQWQFRRQAQALPLLVTVQIFMAIATVVGYGLLVGAPSPEVALYLATGAPTVTLITVGLVMTPQIVAQSKTEGSFDWMRTLPVPRTAFLFSDLLVWTLLALPGMVLGVIAGALRFDITLSPAPWIVAAVIVVSITAAAVGYAMATLLPPAVATLLTQMLIFIVMLFSPVSYPASRLPDWLATAHEFLPIEPMAQLIRAGLVQNEFTMPAHSIIVLGIWCAASILGAVAALRRQS